MDVDRSAPLVTYISDTQVVSVRELFGRLERSSERARAAGLAASCLAVQLRDPELASGELMTLGKKLRALTKKLGMRLIVNDRLDVARLISADGVHLGSRSVSITEARRFLGADAFVSIACHRVDEVVEAARLSANACTLSPICESPGKGAPLGLSSITEARAELRRNALEIGVVALGGIDQGSAKAAILAGADGVATIRSEIDPRDL